MIFALIASLGYLCTIVLLYRNNRGIKRPIILPIMAVALIAHLCQVVIGLQGLINDASLTNILTLIALCMTVGGAIRYVIKADSAGYTVVALIAAVCVWFPVLFPLPETKVHSWSLKFHIVLSISAYIAMGFAALYACFWLLQDYRLRHGKDIFSLALPLNEIERTMITFTVVGEILLTLSLVTGMLFIYDLWAQHVAHKVLFGAISWLIILILLWRHYRQGFRGKPAVIWLLSGFICLGLSYFGTAFVLQFILH